MFRVDRITEIDFLDDRYPDRPAALRQRWLKLMEARDAERQRVPPSLNVR